jgi:DNA-binding ferritin-like protein
MPAEGYARAIFELADAAACAAGDFHTLHLNVAGPGFDTAHEVLEKYYRKADEDYDTWAEWGRCFALPAPNKNEAAVRIQYVSLQPGVESADTAFEAALVVMASYLKALQAVHAGTDEDADFLKDGIANSLQTAIEYWSKEMAFFTAARTHSAAALGAAEGVTGEYV